MDSDINFKHGSLVQIRHKKTKCYLKGTIHPYSSQQIQYICTTNDPSGIYTYWVLEKVHPYSSKIEIGDLIYIKHLPTQMYINFNKDEKSECTHQTLAYINDQIQSFLIQGNDESAHYQQFNSKPIRLIHTSTDHALHSHNILYKTRQLSECNEVTGFNDRDDNDFWEVFPVSDEDKINFENYQIPQIQDQLPELLDGSRMIIRNYWNGQSLHSHNIQYNSTNTQEVTTMKWKRDDNDIWQIYAKQPKLTFGESLHLRHSVTSKYLAHINNHKTYSNYGLQVTCIDQVPKEGWMLAAVDDKTILTLETRFFIFYPSKALYLSITDKPSEKCKHQQEIALVKVPTAKSIWIIEQVIQLEQL